MKLKAIIGMVSLFFTMSASAQFADLTPEQAEAMNSAAGRNIARYNPAHAHGGNIGIQGMDPVSFYSDAPAAGLESIQETHLGVTYRFANDGNRLVFLANPNKYEPTYGGWCARAMATGSPIPVDTSYYSFDFDENGEKVRINFFVSAGALKSYHGLRRRDKRGSAEIAAEMEAGNQDMIDAAEDFQASADEFWARPDFANEAPRFSNGVN